MKRIGFPKSLAFQKLWGLQQNINSQIFFSANCIERISKLKFNSNNFQKSLRKSSRFNNPQMRLLRKAPRFCFSQSFHVANSKHDMTRFAQMKSKEVVRIQGEHMVAVLNGITTSHIPNFFKDNKRQALHTLILSQDGRVKLDIILFKPTKVSRHKGKKIVSLSDDELWCVIDSKAVPVFEQTMRRYSFKRKVDWNYFEQDIQVFQVWNQNWLFAYRQDIAQNTGLMNTDYYKSPNWEDLTEGEYLDSYFYNPISASLGKYAYLKSTIIYNNIFCLFSF